MHIAVLWTLRDLVQIYKRENNLKSQVWTADSDTALVIIIVFISSGIHEYGRQEQSDKRTSALTVASNHPPPYAEQLPDAN